MKFGEVIEMVCRIYGTVVSETNYQSGTEVQILLITAICRWTKKGMAQSAPPSEIPPALRKYGILLLCLTAFTHKNRKHYIYFHETQSWYWYSIDRLPGRFKAQLQILRLDCVLHNAIKNNQHSRYVRVVFGEKLRGEKKEI